MESVLIEKHGGGPNASGAGNSYALLAALDELGGLGGTIQFGPGRHEFDDVVFPRQSRMVQIKGHGYSSTVWYPSADCISSGNWMVDFQGDEVAGSDATHLAIHGIDVQSPTFGVRSAFKGVRVGSSNKLEIRKCFGRFVNGTSWQFERAFNATIQLDTYQCGSASEWAVNVAGTTQNGWNDILLQGATEQDFMGWNIENGAVLRGSSDVKVHGGSDTITGMRLHRVDSGAIHVFATSSFTNDGLIVVSDNGSSNEDEVIDTSNAAQNTRLTIDIQSRPNLSGPAAILCDLQSPQSNLIVRGFVVTSGSTNGVNAIGTSNVNIIVNTDGLSYRGSGSALDDERA